MNDVKNDNTNSTVLVVDDNEQNLELLLAYLEDIGCATLSASGGAEAIEIARDNLPDLILLDVMMPKMSGFEVCRRLKNDPNTSNIPIIMVTALNELGDIESSRYAGWVRLDVVHVLLIPSGGALVEHGRRHD